MKNGCILLLLLLSRNAYAQDSTVPKTPLQVSGYIETYYQYTFNQPSNHQRPDFVYSHNRHHEFNLNLGYLKAAYQAGSVRANLALAAGTYMNANYAAEPGVLKNILEANAGIKLSKKSDLWLDMGILPSHIGFESAIGKDCYTLTRSILADNSPYFETGLRFSYNSPEQKWYLSVLLLNGWQRIQRPDGQSRLNSGIQIQYKPNKKILLNYSNFIGTEKPDSARQIRIFHNIYGQFSLSNKWRFIVGCDLGTEDKGIPEPGWNTWFSPVAILRYDWNEKWGAAARLEHYADESGVIIPSNQPDGFETTGVSLNLDHQPTDRLMIRFEWRNFTSRQPQFLRKNRAVRTENILTTSLAISF